MIELAGCQAYKIIPVVDHWQNDLHIVFLGMPNGRVEASNTCSMLKY